MNTLLVRTMNNTLLREHLIAAQAYAKNAVDPIVKETLADLLKIATAEAVALEAEEFIRSVR